MDHPESRLGAAAIITNPAGEILLVHHTYGPLNWELPGGGREPGESALDAVVREVYEETSLVVVRSELAGVYYEPAGSWHHFTFRCWVAGGQEPQPDQREISECRFWARSRLPRPITDFTVNRIKDATDPGPCPAFHLVGPRRLLD